MNIKNNYFTLSKFSKIYKTKNIKTKNYIAIKEINKL